MEDEKLPITGFGDKKGNQFGLREIPRERTQEMTPRERVLEVLKMPWRPHPDPYSPGRREFLLHEELEQRLEQAITAAVEEERQEIRHAIIDKIREYGPFDDPRSGALIWATEMIRARGNKD